MIIELEGVGKFDVPDGTSKEEAIRIVQEYLSSQKPQAPKAPRLELLEQARQMKSPGLATTDADVARQLGLTARAGVTGALSLPTLASDA